MQKNETQRTVEQIRNLENGFCNPMKLKQAEEIREDLHDRGYSKQEIDEMINDD